MDEFDKFKHKEKFEKDNQIFYPGLADPGLRKILTERINRAADDFNEVSLRPCATADDYREAIKKGLGAVRRNLPRHRGPGARLPLF